MEKLQKVTKRYKKPQKAAKNAKSYKKLLGITKNYKSYKKLQTGLIKDFRHNRWGALVFCFRNQDVAGLKISDSKDYQKALPKLPKAIPKSYKKLYS